MGKMGASPLLTDAVVLLGEARERVADHVDGIPRRSPDGERENRVQLPLSTFKPTTSLGALIAALERCGADADVQFDFCYLRPTTLGSYRGYYDDLALGWTNESVSGGGHWPKVSAVIAELKSAIGKTFEGWKGGSYTMSEKTPVWVANSGDSGGTGIVAIQNEGHTVILITDKVD